MLANWKDWKICDPLFQKKSSRAFTNRKLVYKSFKVPKPDLLSIRHIFFGRHILIKVPTLYFYPRTGKVLLILLEGTFENCRAMANRVGCTEGKNKNKWFSNCFLWRKRICKKFFRKQQSPLGILIWNI